MRRVQTTLAALVTAALLAVPATAVAQDASPFTPLPAAPTEQTTTPVVTTSSSTTDNSGFDTGTAILLAAIGVLLIGAIGYAIWRDARRRAPVVAGEALYEDPSSAPHQKKTKQRAKAKRAKQARKHNRRR